MTGTLSAPALSDPRDPFDPFDPCDHRFRRNLLAEKAGTEAGTEASTEASTIAYRS